jgi:hypothetical protein
MAHITSLAPRKRETLNSLLQLTIDAHGDFDRWRRLKSVSARLRSGGVLWPLKHQQGVLDDVYVRAGGAARKLDQSAARKVIHRKDVHSTLFALSGLFLVRGQGV